MNARCYECGDLCEDEWQRICSRCAEEALRDWDTSEPMGGEA